MQINDRTSIALGMVLTLIGGAAFITRVHFQTVANASSLQELKVDLKDEIKLLRLEMKELRVELQKQHAKIKQ